MNWLKKHLSINQSLFFSFVQFGERELLKIICPNKPKKCAKDPSKNRNFVSTDILNSKSELETRLKQYCFSRRIFWWNFQKDWFFLSAKLRKISPQKMLQTTCLFSSSENVLSTSSCLFWKNYLLAQTASRVKEEESFR